MTEQVRNRARVKADDNKEYRVQLNAPATLLGMSLSPSQEITVNADGLAELQTQGVVEDVSEV